MTRHMDAHLLTTAIFSPESLDESDDSSSGTRLREGSKKERFSLLNDILYFLKETMELDEALKFCPDLEEIGFNNAEGVVRRLLRLAVAMRQDEEKAKRDKNPDIDAFVKKTLKKIYKDHTSNGEVPAKEKEENKEVEDPREEIPGSIHYDLTGEHSDNQEELDEFLDDQGVVEGEHEEGYHTPEDRDEKESEEEESEEDEEELKESFSRYLNESTVDWDSVPAKLQRKIMGLERGIENGEYSRADKKLIIADINKWLEPYTKPSKSKKKVTESSESDWLVEAVNKMFDEDTETPKRLAKVHKLRESYMGELAIEKMEQEEAEQEEEMDPEDKRWLQYHNSFDEATKNDEDSKEDEDDIDPEDKKWLKYHNSFDESVNSDSDYPAEAISIAKNLIDGVGFGEFEEWDTLISSLSDELEPHSYSYNELEDILDIAADQMEEQPVDFDPYEYDAQYRKEVAGSDDWDDLEELGREDMPGRNYGTYKDVDNEDEIDWKQELGREDMPPPGYMNESYLDGDMSGPQDQAASNKEENPENDVILQAAATQLEDATDQDAKNAKEFLSKFLAK